MDAVLITTFLVVLATGLLIAWDIYVVFFNNIPNSKDSISGQLKTAGEKLRAIPFGFGVLGGHFFWPGESLLPKPWSLILLVLLAVAAAVGLRRGNKLFSFVALVAGIVAGHMLWPQ
jgi:hypothetical protein